MTSEDGRVVTFVSCYFLQTCCIGLHGPDSIWVARQLGHSHLRNLSRAYSHDLNMYNHAVYYKLNIPPVHVVAHGVRTGGHAHKPRRAAEYPHWRDQISAEE